ncbi:glycosyltransferase [Candidatus Micrarchaeota archaeon]|nr:glycosyltransferase [Candidatus Micrarchaeota archaeon]
MNVSVIVPTYNEEKSLSRCMASLRNQSFAADEIIVADGQSQDGTQELAHALADKVIVEKKRTIAAGRQAGALAAEGQWLVFADADARYPKDWLLDLLRPFADPGVACTHGKILLSESTRVEHFMADRVMPKVFQVALRLGHPTGAGSNLAIRADVFHQIGGFNTDLVTAEDVDLQKRALRHGKNVFVKDAVAYISPRRIREWGYTRFVGFHFQNWVQYTLWRKSFSDYQPVR